MSWSYTAIFYMGEKEYRMTRGSFTGWGPELQTMNAVKTRVDHLASRHETEHPYSMYRGYEFDKLPHVADHYSTLQLDNGREINMDNVVGIIPGDQVPADLMMASNASSTRVGGTPAGGSGTIGSATRTTGGTRQPTGVGSTGRVGRTSSATGTRGSYDCPTTGTRRSRTSTGTRSSAGSSRGVSSRGSSRGSSIGARVSGTRTRSAGTSVTRSGGKKTGGGIYRGASKKSGDGN